MAFISKPPTNQFIDPNTGQPRQDWVNAIGALIDATTGITLQPFKVSQLLKASDYLGCICMVTDAPGGACAAVSDGTHWRKIGDDTSIQDVGSLIQAVTMIPAATEWGYAPYECFTDDITTGFEAVTTQNGYSIWPENQWTILYSAAAAGRIGSKNCDWKTSLDMMQANLPNAKTVSLFVSWYGTDLRAGSCVLSPGVTQQTFGDVPHEWGCAGFTRSSAYLISSYNGSAAYGGTPDDQSVIDAIKDMHARGLNVSFTPFLLMDIPHGNTLPDPYSGGTGQSVYPWRGRITKQYATADKSSGVDTEVAAFVTQYNAFVTHYANLCASAGGVEVFLLGTELRGLTWLRGADGSNPFVTALVSLAASVKAILPSAKITYAADWSEFTPYVWEGQDTLFHLDPLWSDTNIAAVAFDNYWPLSDWRGDNNTTQLDYQIGVDIYDFDYLTSNIRGGEGYAWYYASTSDRNAQTRTPITDGGYSKPWMYRYKDIWNWWLNQHFNRVNWVQSATETAWVPQSKPIWFTECGCPSVDSGSNQPNVFYDPKSSESALPYYSTGFVDDAIQSAYLGALIRFFDPNDEYFQEAQNPQSTVYSGRMVDLNHITIYTWDARPYPQFPNYTNAWADGPNYKYGQWIEGKIASGLQYNPSETAI